MLKASSSFGSRGKSGINIRTLQSNVPKPNAEKAVRFRARASGQLEPALGECGTVIGASALGVDCTQGYQLQTPRIPKNLVRN
jgi:hypothetical protein